MPFGLSASRGREEKRLLSLSPLTATVLIGGGEIQKPAEEVQRGEMIRIRPGDGNGPVLVAEEIGRQLPECAVRAERLPHEKCEEIRRVKKRGETVAMVGDGINDAAALAEADIAIGSGSDVSKETADVSLVQTDLRKIV